MSTIPLRFSRPCHSTTTYFLLGFPNNLSGVDLSTPMAHLDEMYLLIFTWSILIVCVNMQLATYVGANKMPKAIVRTGKAVQSMSDALHHFDNENGIDHGSGAHTQRSEAGKIVHEIYKKKVFTNIPGRKHTSFPSITCNMFESIN